MQNADFFQALQASTNALFTTLDRSNDQQANTRPAEGKWSILECAEHIFITEIIVVQLLLQAMQIEGDALANTAQERLGKNKIQTILHDRSQAYNAPDMVRPRGEIKSISEFRDLLSKTRQQLVGAFNSQQLNFNCTKTVKHPLLGDLTVLDWMNFLLSHAERHRLQIEEILSQLTIVD